MLRFGNFYVPILISMNKEDHKEEINFGIFKKRFSIFRQRLWCIKFLLYIDHFTLSLIINLIILRVKERA